MPISKSSKVKGISIAISLLDIAIQSILFYGIIIAVYVACFGMPDSRIYECLWVVISVTVAYYSRMYITNVRLFFMATAIIPVIAFMFGTTHDYRISNVLLSFIICAYSVKIKKRRGELVREMKKNQKNGVKNQTLDFFYEGDKVSIYFVLVLAVGYMIGQTMSKPILMYVELLLTIFFIVFQIAYRDLREMNRVIEMNENKHEFPARQIKKVNRFTTISTIVLMMLAMLILYAGPFDGLFKLITDGGMVLLKGFLTVFLVLLRIGGKESNPKYHRYEEEEEEDVEDISEVLEYPDNDLMQAISEVAGIVIGIMFVVGVAYIIISYIKNMGDSRKIGHDYVEFIKPDTKSERTAKKEKTLVKMQTAETKSIRKMYKSLVIKANKDDKSISMKLPEQITKEKITTDEDKASKITYLYEKARYSDEIITKKDVQDFRNLS